MSLDAVSAECKNPHITSSLGRHLNWTGEVQILRLIFFVSHGVLGVTLVVMAPFIPTGESSCLCMALGVIIAYAADCVGRDDTRLLP